MVDPSMVTEGAPHVGVVAFNENKSKAKGKEDKKARQNLKRKRKRVNAYKARCRGSTNIEHTGSAQRSV